MGVLPPVQGVELGRDGPLVSRLGFGCGPGAGLMVGDDAAAQRAAVALAWEGGITLFDTAMGYGAGRSERNLGRVIRELGIGPSVCSKVQLTDDDRRDIRGAVQRYFEASLDRLGRESLDAYFLHNRVGAPPSPSASAGGGPRLTMRELLGPGGVAETFAELRAAGAVKSVGFTSLFVDPLVVVEMIRSAAFDALNWAPREPGAADVLEEASTAGVGVIAIRVLGGRVEVGEDVPTRIRACLADKRVSSAVIGFSTIEHVREALTAV
jgi:aryl-alcohol dehydrogenase-like predicted oxidoreductase